jgi:hypothetical protein
MKRVRHARMLWTKRLRYYLPQIYNWNPGTKHEIFKTACMKLSFYRGDHLSG